MNLTWLRHRHELLSYPLMGLAGCVNCGELEESLITNTKGRALDGFKLYLEDIKEDRKHVRRLRSLDRLGNRLRRARIRIRSTLRRGDRGGGLSSK